MYTIYRQTDPATTVELATYAKFLDSHGRQLITAGANQLRIYRLNPFVATQLANGTFSQGTGLECVLSNTLLAPIRDMKSCPLPGSGGRDCVLLSFDEAKLSVLSYDASRNEIVTLSLHSFEEEMLRGGFTRNFPRPQIAADPEGRVAALLVYGRHLGLVPFRSTVDVFDENDTIDRPAMFSYSLALTEMDKSLQNVADMCFLQAYYEPTLLFLYEPHQTTAGRIVVRQDTYSILAVSLNVKDKVHAVIWSVSLLPYDCFRCLAVPKPVCGVVIFAANSFIYLNQSVPAYGIAVNSSCMGVTNFPLRDQMDKKITLDCCAADFISSSTIIICTRKGEVLVLTMLVDNTNVLKGMQLDKALDSVIPCTVCSCDDGYFFIGSRLGDSVLLRYWETDNRAVKVANEPPPVKKQRDEYGDDIGDLAIYGEVVAVSTVETMRFVTLGFEECDRLINIAPCRHMTIGGPADTPEPLRMYQLDPIFDMVFASGHERDGAITALQRTVRPNIITSSEIPGALQIWTVGKRSGDSSDLFLLVSKEVVTMVLELRDEISELETSGFIMDQSTVAAGDVADGRLIVQVSPMSVILLSGFTRIQSIQLDISFPVSQASIQDPFIVLLTENGEIILVQVTPGGEHPAGMQLVLSRPAVQSMPCTALCVYRDFSGHFILSTGGDTIDQMPSQHKTETQQTEQQEMLSARPSISGDNDEDTLLYGDSLANHNKPRKSVSGPSDILFSGTRFHSSAVHDPNTVMASYWLFVARENGCLEIFSLPDLQLVYVVRKFSNCHKFVFDTDLLHTGQDERSEETIPNVQEMKMVGLGINNARPYLMAVIQDELVIYEAFAFDSGLVDHLSIRFNRVQCPVILRNEKLIRSGRRKSVVNSQLNDFPQLLHYFEGISNYTAGVFVSGPYPCWLFVGKGELRVHPMNLDAAVRSFAAFNNANCPKGFLYLTKQDTMRICTLPKDFEFDSSCPVRKVHIGRTVHLITYLLESHTYAVASSDAVVLKKVVSQIGDDKQFDIIEKEDNNFIFPQMNHYKVQLFSPESWTPVPGAGELQMEEFETVTVMKEVQLKSESTYSGLQNYLAIGTINNYGEEVLVRGRLLIAQVIEVVPEPGQPDTKHKIKTVYCKEQKGPVTSMCSCQGYLLTGNGQKVYIWTLRDNDLIGISFLDLHFYVHQMVGLRNIALVADMYRSLSLIRYQEQDKALSLASRDYRPTDVQAVPMGIEFLVDNSSDSRQQQLAFLMFDEDGNMSVFCYQPEAKESLGGTRLIPRGEMYIGARVANCVRVQGHATDPVIEKKAPSINRHMILFGTLDGALGFVIPLAEKNYRRLHMLQHLLSTTVPHMAGLNPKGARSVRGVKAAASGIGAQANRNVVDGDLVWLYLTLSQSERQELAKRMGTSKEQLLDDLLELQRVTTHF